MILLALLVCLNNFPRRAEGLTPLLLLEMLQLLWLIHFTVRVFFVGTAEHLNASF